MARLVNLEIEGIPNWSTAGWCEEWLTKSILLAHPLLKFWNLVKRISCPTLRGFFETNSLNWPHNFLDWPSPFTKCVYSWSSSHYLQLFFLKSCLCSSRTAPKFALFLKYQRHDMFLKEIDSISANNSKCWWRWRGYFIWCWGCLEMKLRRHHFKIIFMARSNHGLFQYDQDITLVRER